MTYFSDSPPSHFLHFSKGGTSYQRQHQLQRSQPVRTPQKTISPPLSPRTSAENMAMRRSCHEDDRVFHNYIRAFYHFQPSSDISSSTVTLPLEQGDIILVHSIHRNGWADGTLLDTGARGWLPTNYCEAYDEAFMSPLLKALTDFWDVMRVGSHMGLDQFQNQDYMRGLIAGVRFLLEKTDCLTRESQVVQQYDNVRRHRKALLSDLSSLVKQAKKLQDVAFGHAPVDYVDDLFDQMLYRAFRLVTRGVSFLDQWNDEVRVASDFEQQLSLHRQYGDGPLTPPEEQPLSPLSRHSALQSPGSYTSHNDNNLQSGRGSISTAYSVDESMSNGEAARGSILHSHHISYNFHNLTGAPRNPSLASEQLTRAYDGFLGVLGSCIGLHMQSRDSAELTATTQQAIRSSESLLATIQTIFDHDLHRSKTLQVAIEALHDRLSELADSARGAFEPIRDGDDVCEGEGEFAYIAAAGRQVVQAITDCVKAAGDCVAKARLVLDRIGDFDIDAEHIAQGSEHEHDYAPATYDSATDRDVELSYVEVVETDAEETDAEHDATPHNESADAYGKHANGHAPNTTHGKVDSGVSLQPHHNPYRVSDVPTLVDKSNLSVQTQIYNIPHEHATSLPPSTEDLRVAVDVAARRRCDSCGSNLKSSAEATQQSECKPGSSNGESTHSEDDAEESFLEKTFAHELMWNDGQVVGGTLRALVEKLTAHEATPDAVFVSTVYLTFRSFTEPVAFTEELVYRYDYIGETPGIASPVRLRVYNFFKVWLESHWRDECDQLALPIIEDFAKNKLSLHHPSAGDRLAKLCEKVATTHGPVVPRITSVMGKAASAALNNSQIPETPLPSPILTRSQTSLLKQFKINGTNLSILDFDPTELARQLTLKASRVFCSILPEELLNTEWLRKESNLAVNVRAMSTLSTDLTHLVSDTILSHDEPKKRAAVIKQWIKIAAKVLELNNYDTLMAIVCALNSSNITRLKRTWEMLSNRTKESFEKLLHIVDVSKNYAVLRRRLQNHVPPCLPFVGTYLTDLTFVKHGNSNTRCLRTENGTMEVINFDKYMKTARIINDFQRFQIPYRLAEVAELQSWIQENLLRVRGLGDQNFTVNWRRSMSLEPRQDPNAPQEQQQHHHLLSSMEIREKLEMFSRGQIRKKSIPPDHDK
ncbi:hypothetical protein KEM52_003273 [Ascosphaera acerosa]|nr:hypothetical protein KEM52_003273 [Ascosphaera acerosa]